MFSHDKLTFIRKTACENVPGERDKIYWSLHALQKLRAEGLRKNAVEAALQKCYIIEEYSMEGRPFPGCLVLGRVVSTPVHIVVAIDMSFDRMLVVTVYRPSLERWKGDWKSRK